MKRILYIMISIFLLTSCEDDNMKIYEGNAGLYFADSKERDSITYSFNSTTENYITVKIPVETLGMPVGYDRNFSVKVLEEGTTAVRGVDYENLEDSYIMPSNLCSSYVTFDVLYKTELDSGQESLVLELQQSDEFKDVLAEKKKIKIIWSNELYLPVPVEEWDDWYDRYFGPYSKVKHRYILSILEITELPDVTDWNFNDFATLRYQGMIVSNYFAEHEVYDENGKLIEPWTVM